ncbi:MAG: hypothetical protein RR704_21065 [Stenotrophomonas sp.]
MDDDDRVGGIFPPSLPTTAVPVLLYRHDVDQAIGWAISAMR